MGAGSGPPPEPSLEEHLLQAQEQIVRMCAQEEQLREELQKMKGKEPNWGRPSCPPYQPDQDRFSVPRPPGYDPPDQGPVGAWDTDAMHSFLSIKPILVKTPTLFKGEHDDIDQFIGDCLTYFKAF